MEIYLLRHGIAEDGHAGQPDSERALTSEGKRKLRAVLKTLHQAEIAPSLIITSPYRRALQTAQLAAEILDYKGDLLRSSTLEPGSQPSAVWNEIRVHHDEAGILLAGHEPLFGSLTAYLLACPRLRVDFKKGAIACVDIDRFGPEPQGALRWMLTPKLA